VPAAYDNISQLVFIRIIYFFLHKTYAMFKNSVIRHQLAIRAKLSMAMPISKHTSRYLSVSHYSRKDDKDDEKEDVAKASKEKTTEIDSTTTSIEEELKTVSIKLKELQVIFLFNC
jgi:hypothetical protein